MNTGPVLAAPVDANRASGTADGAPSSDRTTRARAGRRTKTRSFVSRTLLLFLVPPLAVCVWGLPYYLLPLDERPWSPLHEWFRPAGLVGQTAGFVSFAFFLFMWLYPIRKKFRFLAFTGSLGRWLDVHIVVGLLTPLIGAIHASWRFHGLIGAGYGAMLVVALSGIVGRYLYVHIPRRRDGLALTREDVVSRRRDLVGKLVDSTGLATDRIVDLLKPVPTGKRSGVARTLVQMIADDFARRRTIRRFAREVRQARSGMRLKKSAMREVTRLARREMALAQQMRLLDATNRVFRLWHTAHKPFAVTALLAVGVHVAVVIVLGATWLL